MKKIIILLLLALSASTYAQQQKGDMQIQAQAAYFNFAGGDAGTVFFNVSKFFTDNVEAGASPTITFGGGTTTLNLALFGKYSFLTSDAKLVPYAGAGISFFDLGGDFGSTAFTITGGTRYFITEQVNIDFGANIAFTEGESTLFILAGLGYIFRWN